MSKVICDICGTAYQDTADKCPICGYSRDMDMELLIENDLLLEEEGGEEKGGLFAAGLLGAELNFDDLALYEDEEVKDPEPADEDEDEEEEPRSNALLVVILVILITLLLALSGYLGLRYFLPNVLEQKPTETEPVATLSTETVASTATELQIPCEGLVLTGGVDPITMEGGYRLLHVRLSPEDTTDKLIFVSEDESVVTVNEDGRMTATGEGETYVTITCGQQSLRCHVVVDYSLATEPDLEETIPSMTSAQETEATEETEPTGATEEQEAPSDEAEEPTKGTAQLKDVVLKLKKTDISLGVGLSYTLPLDCDLSYEEIEWYVEEPYVVKVENGTVTALRKGVTDVVAKYGDQVVECRIRCS